MLEGNIENVALYLAAAYMVGKWLDLLKEN